MSGAPTSPTSRCAAASFTWWRSWTGRAAMSWPGGCRTRWMRASVQTRWRRLWRATTRLRYSTPTKAVSSPASPSPGACRKPASASRWTAAAGAWTTFGRSLGPVAFAASVIERLWRSLKHEAVYLHEIADGFTARRVIGQWIDFYNTQRPHSALAGRTPAEAYRDGPPVDMMDKPLRALPIISTGATAAAGRSIQGDSGGLNFNRNTP